MVVSAMGQGNGEFRGWMILGSTRYLFHSGGSHSHDSYQSMWVVPNDPCEVLMTSSRIKGCALLRGGILLDGPHGGTTLFVITNLRKCGPLSPIRLSKTMHRSAANKTMHHSAANRGMTDCDYTRPQCLTWQTPIFTSSQHALGSRGEDHAVASLSPAS
ncbi:hypothetical protein Acr_01g0007310 [Actinidia rufa]|uniref:Uncharacterized protein n=1 Tax=Actinidia rufa TaxID=165716 RepID=A0A7J0E3S5_9ERIC|nr:hypothetical protein Acr_01g0007310 [Actinidia rufa]